MLSGICGFSLAFVLFSDLRPVRTRLNSTKSYFIQAILSHFYPVIHKLTFLKPIFWS